jgi:hypothetical protein
MSADDPTPQEQEPQGKHRPTALIVLCAVLGIAVVGLAIWAFSAQSDADDAQAKLDAQERAASQATPTPTPTAEPAEPAEVDPATQAQFEQIAEDLGAAGESLDAIEQELEQAAASYDEAVQAREEAEGVVETAQAEAEAFKAQLELTRTCLRGTLDAVAGAYEGGGLETAVAELQRLSGSCRDVTSS